MQKIITEQQSKIIHKESICYGYWTSYSVLV